MIIDSFKTIQNPVTTVLFKVKGSKFIGYAYPVNSETQIKQYLTQVKKEHHAARHWCYAWQLGSNSDKYRYNDDGEPKKSAGPPIFGQLKAFDVTNILLIVVRYFGGVKLGVGGLISAYKTTARETLIESTIITEVVTTIITITFDYKQLSQVMRIVKVKNIGLHSQDMQTAITMQLAIRNKELVRITEIFRKIHGVIILTTT